MTLWTWHSQGEEVVVKKPRWRDLQRVQSQDIVDG
jgi:hypothetical protein